MANTQISPLPDNVVSGGRARDRFVHVLAGYWEPGDPPASLAGQPDLHDPDRYVALFKM